MRWLTCLVSCSKTCAILARIRRFNAILGFNLIHFCSLLISDYQERLVDYQVKSDWLSGKVWLTTGKTVDYQESLIQYSITDKAQLLAGMSLWGPEVWVCVSERQDEVGLWTVYLRDSKSEHDVGNVSPLKSYQGFMFVMFFKLISSFHLWLFVEGTSPWMRRCYAKRAQTHCAVTMHCGSNYQSRRIPSQAG